ncbi:Dynamin- GTPase protein [Dipsacomyces acuminosporus]|nr:Dynamin- GTPase protein [Dipsacomyces acuminosporus]
MDSLIPTVNKLQDVFNTVGQDEIDLPQIVVVGSQSSGKSSVLENLVGRDFLPRGNGIVTRRPLVLQLVNVPSEKGGSQEEAPPARAQFLHLPDKIFTDMTEVRREIERETDRLAGSNKGIVKTPIHLRITSPDVLNLTLVDLPGITKIPVGDQPSDIETQTRNLVFEYISKPNSIVVAISPANVDIVNSESLKFAREVDPEGKRTIGVITKIDLMDRGTNSLDILTGRVYPLRLGFVGVVNRSQEDTIANKPIVESLAYEAEFFRAHPVYRTIQQHCGTANLAKQLNQLLMHHIRDRLPSIKTKINALISQTEQELASYGRMSTENTAISNSSRILKLITLFATEFNSSIEGTASEMPTAELCGGARLYYIFNDIFAAGLDSVNPTANLTNHDIRTAIRNSTGPRASLFVPEIAFQLLVKPQIKSLEPPAQRCHQHTVSTSSAAQLRRPGSSSPIGSTSSSGSHVHGKFFNSFFGAGGKRDGLSFSADEPRSGHGSVIPVPNRLSNFAGDGTSFDDDVSALSAQFTTELSTAEQRDELETTLIRSLILSYFSIVRKSIQDLVPKSIMHLLVNEVCQNMQNRLVEELYKEPLIAELLQEDPALVAERDQCAAMLDVYKKAFAIINESM